MEFAKSLEKLDPAFVERMERLKGAIMDQKYPASVIAPFVNSRMLNYWVEDAELLKKWKAKGWRKFSFLEIVWLKVISDLREFGVSFEILKKLKDNLFHIPNREEILGILKARDKDIRDLLNKGTLSGDAKYLYEMTVKFGNAAEEIVDAEIPPMLANMIGLIVVQRKSADLIVNKEGKGVILLHTSKEVVVPNEESQAMLDAPHISIPLTDIIESFILNDEIDKKLQMEFFSEDEWKIIDILRNERPASLTVKFDDKRKANLIEITRTKKVDLAHRLSNIILKEGYETITLKTQKGKIVTCSQTERIKLS